MSVRNTKDNIMREFKTWRDPYDRGFTPCRPTKIQIKEGLTVLVGCNGAGKSTLLNNIDECLDHEGVPHKFFNNVAASGEFDLGALIYNEEYELAGQISSSSEGEIINIKLSQLASGLARFIETGTYSRGTRTEELNRVFSELISIDNDEKLKKKKRVPKERWILFDATDSGYSIDNIIELKEFFNLMIEDAKQLKIELYILISANEYELASGEQCFDVNRGQYITFKDYNDFKKFILRSRKLKDERLERARQKRQRKSWEVHHGEL